VSASAPLCPNCALALNPVTARARTGYLLALDQCGTCGGLWCDRWELFPIDAAEVGRLDPVDQAALRAPVESVKHELQCPRCRIALRRFRDPLLPVDSRIERCPACDGMWLNRGELRRFKGARSEEPRSMPVPNAALDALIGRYADSANWPTVSQLARATDNASAADDETSSNITSDLLRSALWIGVRALVRLLLGL